MFLALDIGNTNVSWALIENDRIMENGRWGALTEISAGLARLPRVEGVAAATVAPEKARTILAGVQRATRCDPIIAGRDLDAPIQNLTRAPQRVGVDRLLAAVAAYTRTRTATIVVDAGSAITVDCVDAAGSFVGGAILLGPGLTARALHEFTERLPQVKIARPESLIGRDTEESMQAGIYWGAVFAVEGMIEAIKRHGTEAETIITGGDGEWIAAELGLASAYVPTLTLEGLWIAYKAKVGRM